MSDHKYLAWIDLETTGTDVQKDYILEFAMVVTTASHPFEEMGALKLPVRPTDPAWSHRMDEFVLEMHTNNDLLIEVFRTVSTPVHLAEVEDRAIEILKAVGVKHDFAIAGSGVAAFDRHVIRHQMPKLDKWLRYYSIDVGVLRRTLLACGVKDAYESPTSNHRAYEDVRDALARARHYGEFLSQLNRD